MQQPAFNLEEAHQWFAVECNNAAWDLIEKSKRNRDETELMIHQAHAACYHWLQVGEDVHHLRALVVLTTAYSAAGRIQQAMHHAHQCMTLLNAIGAEATPFDHATALGCTAEAFRLAGRNQDAQDHYNRAKAVVDTCDDPDQVAVWQGLYGVA